MFAVALLLAAAGPAQASKGKKKPPKYVAAMELTAHTSADVNCETWTSNWTYASSYYPTTLESAASLDARTRTASGTLEWTRDSCTDFAESGTCPITAMTPYPGIHAGDEDAWLRKVAGGLSVDVDMTQFLEVVGSPCAGAVYAVGSEGGTYNETTGFIPAARIGRKVITVSIAGSFNYVEGSEHSDGQMNGTLTLTRKGKKRG